jgi:light-regulated signal transduction histidine kinase (bacteriophytochrome)
MSAAHDELARRYHDELVRHFDHAAEETLAAAYELGRQALVEGSGILDVIDVHHRALAAEHARIAEAPLLLDLAAAFLAESLTPFEMSFFGFSEALAQREAMNLDLQEKNRLLLQAKERAESARQELEAFSYSVSHDLRAPLRAIDGFSAALEERSGSVLDDEGRGHLRRVRAAAQRMGQLIDDLLRLARTARTALRPEPVDLTRLAHDVAQRLREAEPERAVDVVIAPEMRAVGDPGLMRVVYENLMSNAWKFTRKRAHAHIEVSFSQSEEGLVFFVRDDGAGFDATYAHKLFHAFQRLHGVDEFEGTGIGLATVGRVIARHGGRVWAEGALEKGATVYFVLEAAPAAT